MVLPSITLRAKIHKRYFLHVFYVLEHCLRNAAGQRLLFTQFFSRRAARRDLARHECVIPHELAAFRRCMRTLFSHVHVVLVLVSVPHEVRNYAVPPDHFLSEISFSHTCNIPNLKEKKNQ